MTKIPIGKDDENKMLYFPLHNMTIVSAPGGGKSAALIQPILLTQDRPMFVLDIKGELWATSARYRATGFGRQRQVVSIDPFGILQQEGFYENKPPHILKKWTINPFDYISNNEFKRDRDINTLVQSLVSRHDDKEDHWSDNAEILLAGLIDYILKAHKPENRSLLHLHDYLTGDLAITENLLKKMLLSGGQAQAAAAQVLKTAPEERGSIYSSTYRQVKWLVDRNTQETFKESNFDLNEFLKGDMDIFLVLPSDQIKYHKRVFRMLFALTSNIIAQTLPRQLPDKKFLYVLDELGQLEYSPDVETAIEILRGCGVVVLAAFQSLGQIKLYKKPDLFLNAKIKHIFEVDDEATMRWIQTLGGERDVLTKSVGNNQGNSYRATHLFDNNHSQGESLSLQETKAHLIPINEIRELPDDQQFVFIRGYKPIKCYRAYYYDHPYFEGRYDANPYIKKRT